MIGYEWVRTRRRLRWIWGYGDGQPDAFTPGALITNRDGIVGPWVQPDAAPPAMVQDDPGHLRLWAAPVRQSVYNFEMFSRINFSFSGDTARVWHLESAANGPNPPTAEYQPLMAMTRPGEDDFLTQLVYLENYAALRPDRGAEILAQVGVPIAFWQSIPFITPERTIWTLDLIFAAYQLANFVEMRLKHALACRRPIEYSAQVQPIIPTPLHGTLPSGHATESFAVATVLSRLLQHAGGPVYGTPEWPLQLMRLASRISVNRTVAGVHFPVDSAAGAALGMTLGNYLVQRCLGRNTDYSAVDFDGTAFADDFNWTEMVGFDAQGHVEPVFTGPAAAYLGHTTQSLNGAQQSGILTWLWDRALEEWA